MWVMLTPREVELVFRPVSATGQNALVLQEVQLCTNKVSGEANFPPSLVVRIRGAARNWQGGYEAALKALCDAIDRHAN